MIDHVSIQVRDVPTSAQFYDAVLKPLGGKRVLDDVDRIGYGSEFPDFWIGAATTGVRIPSGAHLPR
jgi:catechol 2,3-dioxygenase-like lactoylglutathione lyase family enzyme